MQYKNTNSGRRNLLDVKSHIKKIGFELVLKKRISRKFTGVHVKNTLNGTISVPTALRSIVVLLAEDVWRQRCGYY